MSWTSLAKDNHNSRIADDIVDPFKFNEVPKWVRDDLPVGTGGYNGDMPPIGTRLLQSEGRIFTMIPHNCRPIISYSKQYLLAWDSETGSPLWNAGWGYGDPFYGSSLATFALYNGYIYGGFDHSKGFRVNVATGQMTYMSGYGATSPTNGFINSDEDGVYGIGDDGVDSVVLRLKYLKNNLVEWQNTRSMTTLGIYNWFSSWRHYNSLGQICTHGGSLFLSEGKLVEYNKTTGLPIWSIGQAPCPGTIGNTCYHGGVVYEDGCIYTIARDCTYVGGIQYGGYGGYESQRWGPPRLVGFNAVTKSQVCNIELPDFMPYFDRVSLYYPFDPGSQYAYEVIMSHPFYIWGFDGIPFKFIISSGTAYVSCFDRILKIRLSDGYVYWTYTLPEVNQTLVDTIINQWAYGIINVWCDSCSWIGSGSENGTWKDVGEIVLSGNILFVSFRFRNQIRAIDTTTGNSAWSFSAPGQYEYFSSLIVSDNKLFASTRLGHLYCFEE